MASLTHTAPRTPLFRSLLGHARPAALAMAASAVLTLLGSIEPTAAQMGPKLPRKLEEEKAPKGPSGPVEQQFPFGSTWVLFDVGGKAVTSGEPASFRLDDKLRAEGFGGCNTFSMALYPIKEQKLAAGSIATTRKSCGKPVDDAERALLVTMHSLPTWHLEPNGDLTIKGAASVMRFRRGL